MDTGVLWLRYDLVSSPESPSKQTLVSAAIEQACWADRVGFDTIQLGEHHGAGNGYNPSPLILASGIASRTSRIRIHPVLLLPLYDEVKLAEDLIMLDILSQGRLDVTVALGYIDAEFQMFGASLSDRGWLTEAKLQTLRRAFRGEAFNGLGKRGRITPAPVQANGPRLYVGGSLKASARRAAKFGDGYYPMSSAPEFVAEYKKACADFGRQPGPIISGDNNAHGVHNIYVTEDPDMAWHQISRYVMEGNNFYLRAARVAGQYVPYEEAGTIADLKALGHYLVLTPPECVRLMNEQAALGNYVVIQPLIGGMPPELSWKSLELIESRVLPHLDRTGTQAASKKTNEAGSLRAS